MARFLDDCCKRAWSNRLNTTENIYIIPKILYYIIIKSKGIRMSNINIELKRYTKEVIDRMVEENFVKTKTEAIRLALFEFDQMHGLTDDELYGAAAEKVLKGIKSGKEKVHAFTLPK